MRAKDSRRMKTRKQQAEAVQHFHPRRLARGIVHTALQNMGATGVNKVVAGATQSPFAQNWRGEAEAFTAKKSR